MKSTEEDSLPAAVPHGKPARIRDQLKMVSAPVYIAVMLFAMSTWIAVVGIWVEMPLLVHRLPESWKLPSYLVIIIQCANIGPATYAIWDKMRQRNQQSRNEHQAPQQQQEQRHSYIDAEVIISLIIILTAIVSTLMLSLFWDHTLVVASENRSVALLTLVCVASLSCCTSSVVFLPYMARFPSVYISAYYFGQGLCGLVPGLLGLAQVAGHEPQCRNKTDINDMTTKTYDTIELNIVHYSSARFSVTAFFALITVLLCVSAAAFCSLSFVKRCRSEMAVVSSASDQKLDNMAETSATREAIGLLDGRENPESDTVQSSNAVEVVETTAIVLQRRRYISLYVTICIISALWNGILPATQTYTCLPYGHIVYRLAVCLSWVVSPLATLPNMLAPTSSLSLITGLGMLASVIAALHLVLAAQSPHPVLQGSVVGQVIVVSFSFLSSLNLKLCFTYHCTVQITVIVTVQCIPMSVEKNSIQPIVKFKEDFTWHHLEGQSDK